MVYRNRCCPLPDGPGWSLTRPGAAGARRPWRRRPRQHCDGPHAQLKPGLFLLTGAGANTLVRVTTEGLIVVDTKNPGDEQANSLLTQIKAVESSACEIRD